MITPDPALDPVIPPVIVPIVQLKSLGVDAVKLIFGLSPLQILDVAALVTVGDGRTVTVIAKGDPTQDPVAEVGVTKYTTDPAINALGLVSS